MDINDSVVLVTGGNRGLGKSLVQAFVEAGARKIYVGSRRLIETPDPRLQPIQLDITHAQDVAAAAQTCRDITILVNNAGIAAFTPFLTMPSVDQARQEMETNYFGTLAMVRAFAPTSRGTAEACLSTCSLSSAGSPYQRPGPIVRPSLPNWH